MPSVVCAFCGLCLLWSVPSVPSVACAFCGLCLLWSVPSVPSVACGLWPNKQKGHHPFADDGLVFQPGESSDHLIRVALHT